MSATVAQVILCGVLILMLLPPCQMCSFWVKDATADGVLYVDGSSAIISFEFRDCSSTPDIVSVKDKTGGSDEPIVTFIKLNASPEEETDKCFYNKGVCTVEISLKDRKTMDIELKAAKATPTIANVTLHVIVKESPEIISFTLNQSRSDEITDCNTTTTTTTNTNNNSIIYVEVGSTVTLTCQWYPGKPARKNASLQRNGRSLQPPSALTLLNRTQTVLYRVEHAVDNFRAQDEGDYTCQILEAEGPRVAASLRVKIRGRVCQNNTERATNVLVVIIATPASVVIVVGVIIIVIACQRRRKKKKQQRKSSHREETTRPNMEGQGRNHGANREHKVVHRMYEGDGATFDATYSEVADHFYPPRTTDCPPPYSSCENGGGNYYHEVEIQGSENPQQNPNLAYHQDDYDRVDQRNRGTVGKATAGSDNLYDTLSRDKRDVERMDIPKIVRIKQ